MVAIVRRCRSPGETACTTDGRRFQYAVKSSQKECRRLFLLVVRDLKSGVVPSQEARRRNTENGRTVDDVVVDLMRRFPLFCSY